jgi:hypothetical protein
MTGKQYEGYSANELLKLQHLLDKLCAPEATDDIQDIDFDEDNEAATQDFIQNWIGDEQEN